MVKIHSSWPNQGFRQHTPEQLTRARNVGSYAANTIRGKQDAYLGRGQKPVTLARVKWMERANETNT